LHIEEIIYLCIQNF